MTWTKRTKPTQVTTYFLLEDGSYLLQEDGFKFVTAFANIWETLTRPAYAAWTKRNKPT